MSGVELIVQAPGKPPMTLLLAPGERLVLGRGREAGLRLDDMEASRRHLALELSPSGVQATDLGSGNGTTVGGNLLPPNQPVPLVLPAELQVGTHQLLVRQPGSGAVVEPVQARLRDEYDHVATLGSGAHGTVSAAVHRSSGRRVAIKAFRADGLSETIRQRFLREGRIRIESPHVAQVHDVRQEGGNLFIVMEYVEGRSARDLVANGPLPVAQAVRIATDVARGLAAAHKQGVVHRDVKPSNIIVCPDGSAKLVDFGIAKMKGEVLTHTGQGIGTLAYIAPEQALDAKRADPLADLYSLGATLYHLLAGQPPFDSQDPAFLNRLFEDDPPKLTRLRPDCPPKLARFVQQLLEKEPEDRGRSAQSVTKRFERLGSAD